MLQEIVQYHKKTHRQLRYIVDLLKESKTDDDNEALEKELDTLLPMTEIDQVKEIEVSLQDTKQQNALVSSYL